MRPRARSSRTLRVHTQTHAHAGTTEAIRHDRRCQQTAADGGGGALKRGPCRYFRVIFLRRATGEHDDDDDERELRAHRSGGNGGKREEGYDSRGTPYPQTWCYTTRRSDRPPHRTSCCCQGVRACLRATRRVLKATPRSQNAWLGGHKTISPQSCPQTRPTRTG